MPWRWTAQGTFTREGRLLLPGADRLLELKANHALALANEVQLVNYLTATVIDIGLLLNFGAQRLEFKRKSRTYRPKPQPKDSIL